MSKKKTYHPVIVTALAFALVSVALVSAWKLGLNKAGEPLDGEEGSLEASLEAPVATQSIRGLVTRASTAEIEIAAEDGSRQAFALGRDTQFLRLKAAAVEAGSPVYVYVSSSTGPVSAFLGEPSISDAGEDIEIVSGRLVSVAGTELTMTVDGKTRSFVFKDASLVPRSTALETVSAVEPGAEATIEFRVAEGEKKAVSVLVR